MKKTILDRCADDVSRFGWHAVFVPASAEGPSFGYSVGFMGSFSAPEVIVTGLPIEVTHNILNNIHRLYESGWKPQGGELSSEIIEGYQCAFHELGEEDRIEWLGVAEAFYEGRKFDALQCFWPDKQGRFPYSANSDGFSSAQPILGIPREDDIE